MKQSTTESLSQPYSSKTKVSGCISLSPSESTQPAKLTHLKSSLVNSSVVDLSCLSPPVLPFSFTQFNLVNSNCYNEVKATTTITKTTSSTNTYLLLRVKGERETVKYIYKKLITFSPVTNSTQGDNNNKNKRRRRVRIRIGNTKNNHPAHCHC